MEVRRINNLELYHHGIKGQRWGVRRYQNEDGSLTSEGRKRYGLDESGHLTTEKGQKALYKDIKKYRKDYDALLKREMKVHDQLYAQTLGKTGKKIAQKEEDAIFKKRYKKATLHREKMNEILKNNTSKEEMNQLKKLIKKDNSLLIAIEESEYGSPKYNELIKQSKENSKQMKKIYADVGQRVAGKYANKHISGSKFWGTERTMRDEIVTQLCDRAIDELMEKGKW